VPRLPTAIILLVLLTGAHPPPKAHVEFPPAPVARGKKGVVATAHPLASSAGLEILRKGGNAMDAAVAAAFALSVVEPHRSGIGGGGFLVYWDAESKKATAIDFREIAPLHATRDMYLVDGKPSAELSTVGIKSVAVPGLVPGLEEAQKRLGKKKLADVLGPAIKLAEEGFLVYPVMHKAMAENGSRLRKNAAAASIFLDHGEPFAVGERLFQADMAKTLKQLAQEGAKLFTEGRVAQAIAKESARLGGVISQEDLKSFKPRVREALAGEYRGHTVITMPPPSSGVHMLQILKMHEIDLLSRQVTGNRVGVEDLHMTAEIMRRAFADRAKYSGDPAFTDVPVEKLLSENYLRARYQAIDPRRATPSTEVKAGELAPDKHTTHLTVIDKNGNVAALTQTINEHWGSGVVVPGTGVLLNDEMDDFSAAPGTPNSYGLIGGEANSIQPGKVPLSSMCPTIVVKDGKVELATGAPGGSTIITTVAQVLMHVLDQHMDVAHAVAARRIHMQWMPDVIMYEPRALDSAEMEELKAMGHKLTERDPWGLATAIEVFADGTRYGASDPRGDGGCDAE
jgi:gamma-glutamyltranspeptidase/glutathione hydrolase